MVCVSGQLRLVGFYHPQQTVHRGQTAVSSLTALVLQYINVLLS